MSKKDKLSTKPECGAKTRGGGDATSDTHGGSRLMTTDGAKQKSKRGDVRYSTKPKCGAKTNKKFNGGRPCQRRAGFGTDHVGTVLLANSAAHKWEPVDPGSIAKRLWKVACNKK